MKLRTRILIIAAIAGVAACSKKHSVDAAVTAGSEVTTTAKAVRNCDPSGTATPICGLQAPEDIALHPDGRHLLISQTNGPTHRGPSTVAMYDTVSGKLDKLPMRSEPRTGWGDPACTYPAGELDFHGIDIFRQPDGVIRLLVVSHGDRESIEMFEVTGTGPDSSLVWHGCVLTPPKEMLNDVSALADGSFVVTVTASLDAVHSPDPAGFILSGVNTGHVLRWSPKSGIEVLPNTDQAAPDGIVVLPGEQQMLFAAWSGKKLLKYDLKAKRTLAEIPLDFLPDNLTLGPKGELMTAGMNADVARQCLKTHFSECGGPIRIVAIDPVSLAVTQIPVGPAEAIDGPSVAVPVGNGIYVGSLTGDRIVRFELATQ